MSKRDNNLMEREVVIKVEELSLGYDKNIYSGISGVIGKGEMVALVGPNGVGKSTLLKSIATLIPYRSGKIEIYGREVDSYRREELPKLLSYLPSQSPRTRNLTLKSMLATSRYSYTNWLGQLQESEERLIERALKRVGLQQFGERDISTLSDGEFQRATIARSLVQESKVLLLDEPVAFLDIANNLAITRLLREICDNEERTILFSTHDLTQAIKLADQIWIMGYQNFHTGAPTTLIEKGAFDSMFKDSSLKFDKELLTFL